MAKERNKPIGEVECSHRGCDLKAQVFKFRSKAAHEWQQRRAGKLYSCCDKGHRCEDQDYLLEHATIWGAKSGDETAPVTGESAPVKTSGKPVPAPVPKAPARTSPTLAQSAGPTSIAKPEGSSQSSPSQSDSMPSKTWGFFQ